VPSQILTEKDGRIAISFLYSGAGEAPLVLRAVKDAASGGGSTAKSFDRTTQLGVAV